MLSLKSKFTILLSLVILITACSSNNDNKEEEVYVEGSLPKLKINTLGNEIPSNPKVDALLTINVGDNINYDGKIAIETRGNSSQEYPKKSYGFETRDSNNEDLNISLLGMPIEEDWILSGPYSDKSLLRNAFIYTLSREIGSYASRTVFTELTLNDEYQGVYVLMEKLKRDENRIDISKLNPDENSGEDITGGYILKIDRPSKSDANKYFISAHNPPYSTKSQQVHFVFEDPDGGEISSQQRNYISTYVADFENALASSNFTDPISGYVKYINVSSFIDFFLLNELSNNVDAYRLSTYFTKDKNGKLNMGPIWDFNYALGNVNYCGADKTDVWAYTFNERCGNHDQQVPFWWYRFMEDPNFVNKLKNRWQNLRNDEFTEANLHKMIDDHAILLKDTGAAERNFETWDILGAYVYPNAFIGNTYNEEVEFLKEWVSNRLTWLDSEIAKLN